MRERLLTRARPGALWLAGMLWRVFGVTHDPRRYKCRGCGKDERREHDHMTNGHATRLCGGCMDKPAFRRDVREAFGWT